MERTSTVSDKQTLTLTLSLQSRHFISTRDILFKSETLKNMVNDYIKLGGSTEKAIFINRSSLEFEHILAYLTEYRYKTTSNSIRVCL